VLIDPLDPSPTSKYASLESGTPRLICTREKSASCWTARVLRTPAPQAEQENWELRAQLEQMQEVCTRYTIVDNFIKC
jgi:hypothetical protein